MLRIIGAALAAALFFAAPGAQAQQFPSKEIALIVPFNPGGSTDFVGRGFAEVFKTVVKQAVTVQNVPGAGTATGFTKLSEAPADGYTLAVMGPFMITTALRQQLKVPLENYTYLARLSLETFVLGVPTASPHRTLKDYIAAAKKGAGAVAVGTAGSGTLTHLTAAAIAGAIGAELNIVHFAGGGKLTPAVLGGHVDSGMFSQVEVVPHAGPGGGLRVLATFGAQRSKPLPDAPTLNELGIAGVPAGPWQGIVAPKGLPPAAAAALGEAIDKTVKHPDWLAFLDKNGLSPYYARGTELDAFLKSEIDTTRKLLQATGLDKP